MTLRPVLLLLTLATITACDPQKSKWGLGAITTLQTPTDPPVVCGQTLTTAPDTNGRAACLFGTGTPASKTLGVSADVLQSLPIRHVIVVMKENRSFDHLFGKLHDLQPGVEAVPATYQNLDLSGAAVPPFHADTTCLSNDPPHQAEGMATCVNGGKMDGFVRNAARGTGTDGHFVMAYYDQTDLPFYSFLASTYALSDRHFAPMRSGTFGNRNYLLFGTNAGVVDTGIAYPSPDTPSILHTLMNAGFTWAAYSDSEPFSGTLHWTPNEAGVHPLKDVYDALDHGTLPNVAFVDGIESVDDDHPLANLQQGEAWLKTLYDHAIASPQWGRTAILWTYDEGGAFADHVPPPTACRVDDAAPFTDRGPRIPLVAISPWARRSFVSHTVTDHTAITRFIEAIFGLPALTARDANSEALLDLFDFSCGRDMSAPAAPAPGTGKCAR
jgi:phospholipase C